MIEIVPLTSLENPDVQPYRTLRQPVEHFRQGIFIAEGEKVVRRLLESDLTILSVLMTHEWLEEYRALLAVRTENMVAYVGTKDVLETIVGFNLHQGIMALGKIPTPVQIDSVLEQSSRPFLFAAIDGLTNAENLGVLVRNCAAFGVQAILVGETSSSPFLRRAVRNSMGAVFKLPIVHCGNLVETLERLRKSFHVKVIAAHPHAHEQRLSGADFTAGSCIVFGSEGSGISPAVLAACDIAVAIPMAHGVDSLNVASASAVFLYEVMRQRMK